MKSRLIASIFIAGVSFVSTGYANSLTCELSRSFDGENAVVNIAGAISVGEDVPVGTVVYQAVYRSRNPSGVECRYKGDWTGGEIKVPYVVDTASTPLPIVPGVTGPAGESVYQTNVPGIGVSLATHPGGGLPYKTFTEITPGKEPNGLGGKSSGFVVTMFIRLIKTGEVDAGTVNGITFPTATVVFTTPTTEPQHTFNGFPIQSNKLSFSGQIQVVKSTCKVVTENIVVDLGNYEVSEFTRQGFTTGWRDASIKLVGCSSASPAYYSKTNNTISITGGGTLPLGIKDVSNRISFMISPAAGVFDASNGIIQLTPSPNNASGVGIQIGYANNGIITPLRLSAETAFTPPVMQASMQIPLAARYIQMENEVTPGVANGAVVYTINYY